MAITLSSVHSKSTWEAGEIMGKSHYKYLEIHARGVKFFRLFTEYFTLFDSLVTKDMLGNEEFAKYLELLIIKRKTLKEVITELGDERWANTKYRNSQIDNCLVYLSRKDRPIQAAHLINLIKDFDRWNNFRILPLSLQEPSAFKRRNRHKVKKLLSLNSNLHPLAIQRILKLYELKRNNNNKVKLILYLPVISIFDKKLIKIVKVASGYRDEISKIPMFLFNRIEDATDYLNITSAYLFKENHSCRDGQIFWPELRYIIKKAVNHDEVMGVNPTRKAFLDNAGIDPEIRKFLKRKELDEDRFIASQINSRIKKAKQKSSRT